MSTQRRVSDLIGFLEQQAPLTLAESWDNVGLLLGRASAPVQTVMTCLTLTGPVADEAVHKHVQLIVTHHPILFRGVKRLTDATAEGRMLLTLAGHGIAVFCAHTAFDSAREGINHQLAVSLGLRDLRPLRPDHQDSELGAGRFGLLPEPVSKQVFLKRVAEAVNAGWLEHAWNGNAPVQRVAVACGSAAEFLADATAAGCDTFVTGEARFHAALEAQAAGVNLILTGHYCSERPALVTLARTLQHEFPDLKVLASEQDGNPLELFQAPVSS